MKDTHMYKLKMQEINKGSTWKPLFKASLNTETLEANQQLDGNELGGTKYCFHLSKP